MLTASATVKSRTATRQMPPLHQLIHSGVPRPRLRQWQSPVHRRPRPHLWPAWRARLTAVVKPVIPRMIRQTMLWMMPRMTAGTCWWQRRWDWRPPKLNQKCRSGTRRPRIRHCGKTQATSGWRPFLFSVVVESTPDYVDQLAEHFLTFEPIESHTGDASNMSGKYNELQTHMKKRNPLIHYVPCAAHSLNLVGVNTTEPRGWILLWHFTVFV